MTRRWPPVLGRLSPMRRRLVLVAVALVVLWMIAALTTASRHPRSPQGNAATVAHGLTRTPRPPAVDAAGLAEARLAAARFLPGYLQFAYGRGRPASVTAVTPALRSRLESDRVQLTPVEQRRHPRVVSLAAVGRARGMVLATALIEDGGVTGYALQITLRRDSSGWRVSAVDGR
jgi:hypothetical protein